MFCRKNSAFKISRSKFSDFIDCPRCFYLDRVKGLESPSVPGWSLNVAVDELLKKDNLRSWQKNLGYVSQSIFLSDKSIRENIAFGVPNRKIDNLKIKIISYREKKNNTFKEYNSLKNKELENFFVKITPLLEEFMEKNSIKIIIEKKNILIAQENYDKTNDLVNFINTKLKYDVNVLRPSDLLKR